MRLYLSFLFWACLCGPVLSAQPEDSVDQAPTSVSHDFAQWCRVANRTFYLERISLAEIVKILGKGMVVNTDASDPGNADPTWAVAYQNGGQVIRFESDGDMGGPDHLLTMVTVIPSQQVPSAEKLPYLKGPVAFDFGTPGMSFRQLEKRLGKTTIQGGNVIYSYEGRVSVNDVASLRVSVKEGKSTGDSLFDVTGYLKAGIENGRVISIVMSHITSS